ncbi:MAG: TetR/AcrR family transcriptional regulator [Deltaproteobacteria bacterium]|jgi:AcrR family transcriptional regulator|nr:TetR/AcrR family transcriptional regulator [Deltaproteobacteria bacterium]
MANSTRKEESLALLFSKLQLAALSLFAELGYDLTSMSMIAARAGIRKSSIYAHFDSKESLYLSLLDPIIEKELAFLDNQFKSPQIATFRQCIVSCMTRFHEDPPVLKFLLRSNYLPPAELAPQILPKSRHFYLTILNQTEKSLAKMGVPKKSLKELAHVYSGLLDSHLLTLIYCPDITQTRLKALWPLFKKHLESLMPSDEPES